eukprot:TRINITY_DN8860_c0_g1_i1.p3 TRINITY_DN8860_c0_g1~~TRINITY_DN8860_c0_g1_i1.p3  ORF type:complete len:129 (+),score=21.75 TRINITY_DN8860_c0_g1_i1:60-389(+)
MCIRDRTKTPAREIPTFSKSTDWNLADAFWKMKENSNEGEGENSNIYDKMNISRAKNAKVIGKSIASLEGSSRRKFQWFFMVIRYITKILLQASLKGILGDPGRQLRKF